MQVYDKLWKGIIEDLFADFLRFFYPNAEEIFDFDKGFEFLDNELQQLFPEKGDDSRYVDKLVKVWLKDGTSRWILIHCEVQGYNDAAFKERMFIYFYRIFDKFHVEISSLAIFSDPNPSFHPKKYQKQFMGTKLTFEFETYKILNQNPEVLATSENPFAIVILAVYHALKNRDKDDNKLLHIKLDLMRRLKNKNFPKEKIRKVFEFIKRYIRFADEKNNLIFEDKLETIFSSNVKNMGIEEIILEDLKEEAFKVGVKKGLLTVIKNARLKGFTLEIIAEIVNLPIKEVRQLLDNMGIE